MTSYFKKCSKIAPRYILSCLILIFTLVSFSTSYGATVILSWDANPEPDIGGYKVYYGTSSGDYDYVIDVGDVTNYELDLSPGERYFAITAYDTARNESGYSEEISFWVEPSTTWYFPYGYNKASKKRFTYLYLQNPNDEEAYVTVSYMLGADSTEVREHVVEANSLYVIPTHNDIGYPGRVFGMEITSDLPIVAERRLRWGYKYNWMAGAVIIPN